jgi:predicted nucleic acid-binding protein
LSEPGGVAYADASALVKLVLEEPEAAALERRLDLHDLVMTSAVGVVEFARAVRRAAGAEGSRGVRAVAAGLVVVPLSQDVRRAAQEVEPAGLRTLDAIHVASARIGAVSLGGFYCYDRRLCEAAAAAGLPVESPGA